MLGWFRALMPKEERFFELFARHARVTVAGAEALRCMLNGGMMSCVAAKKSTRVKRSRRDNARSADGVATQLHHAALIAATSKTSLPRWTTRSTR